MKTPTDIRRCRARGTAPHNSEPDPTEVIPFGRYGAGFLTGHPVGLVIVLGVLLIGFVGNQRHAGFSQALLVWAASVDFSYGFVTDRKSTPLLSPSL
jgi:hypothetical protein